MVRSIYFILGGFVSISLYLILILGLSYYFYKSSQKPKVYALTNEVVLEVVLDNPTKEKAVKENKSNSNEKKLEEVSKESASEKDSKGGSLSAKTTINSVKSLFSSLNVKKPTKVTKELPFKSSNIASRFKSKDIKSIKKPKVDISKFSREVSMKKSVLSFNEKKISGEVDEYYSKIYKILAENWYPDSSDKGYGATVLVTITNKGEFFYKIKQNSNNDNFNEMLVQFLESMKLRKFPPYKKGKKSVIEVYFKTEE